MREAWQLTTESRTELATAPRDHAIAALAARQHGVVALDQLLALSLSPSAVRSRVAAGKLHRLHRGVYAVGHRVIPLEGHWLAAVVACGEGAVLSHCSAAALWRLVRTDTGPADVTSPRRHGRTRAGICVHGGQLAASEVTTVRGVPCTTVARTLIDLAEVVDRRVLARAVDEAEANRVLDLGEVRTVIGRWPTRRGATVLRGLLVDHEPGSTLTRSELEERFLHLCEEAGVPRPRVNAQVDLGRYPIEVDFLWPDARLIVEADGHQAHGTRRAFERDRDRDRRLVLAGWRVVRFTWRQVVHAPAEVAHTLRRLLARAR